MATPGLATSDFPALGGMSLAENCSWAVAATPSSLEVTSKKSKAPSVTSCCRLGGGHPLKTKLPFEAFEAQSVAFEEKVAVPILPKAKWQLVSKTLNESSGYRGILKSWGCFTILELTD